MILDFDKVFVYTNLDECMCALIFAYNMRDVLETAPVSVRKQVSLDVLNGLIDKAEAYYLANGGKVDED